MSNIVLASSSVFRRSLLERLEVPFCCDSPDIDERQQLNETPADYVQRLSLEKAQAVATRHPNSLVIASDQCSVLDQHIYGKPHNHETAIKQLQQSSGKRVSFLTGLCVMNTHTQQYQLDLVPYYVDFRQLDDDEIERYLLKETPYQCAGSFKSEGLGVTLFKRMQGDDPTALIGLPLIRLSEMLREFAVKLP